MKKEVSRFTYDGQAGWVFKGTCCQIYCHELDSLEGEYQLLQVFLCPSLVYCGHVHNGWNTQEKSLHFPVLQRMLLCEGPQGMRTGGLQLWPLRSPSRSSPFSKSTFSSLTNSISVTTHGSLVQFFAPGHKGPETTLGALWTQFLICETVGMG